MRRVLLLPVLVILLTGCGGSGGGDDDRRAATPTPAPLPTEPVEIAAEWAKAVRANDLDRASALFALPAVVSNGTPLMQLASRPDVRIFNSSFPCGALLLRAKTLSGGRVLATYTLTERPGAPVPCGSGVGGRVGVLFTIKAGKITRWIRANPESGPARTPTPEV